MSLWKSGQCWPFHHFGHVMCLLGQHCPDVNIDAWSSNSPDLISLKSAGVFWTKEIILQQIIIIFRIINITVGRLLIFALSARKCSQRIGVLSKLGDGLLQLRRFQWDKLICLNHHLVNKWNPRDGFHGQQTVGLKALCAKAGKLETSCFRRCWIGPQSTSRFTSASPALYSSSSC